MDETHDWWLGAFGARWSSLLLLLLLLLEG
jgi:hypothetical protein